MGNQWGHELRKSQFRMRLDIVASDRGCAGRQQKAGAIIKSVAKKLFQQNRIAILIRRGLEFWKYREMRLVRPYGGSRAFAVLKQHQISKERARGRLEGPFTIRCPDVGGAAECFL